MEQKDFQKTLLYSVIISFALAVSFTYFKIDVLIAGYIKKGVEYVKTIY